MADGACRRLPGAGRTRLAPTNSATDGEVVSRRLTAAGMDLESRFEKLWRRLGAAGDGRDPFARLMTAYAEPHRAYHTAEHVADCLTQLDTAPGTEPERELVEAAIWFHDVVYDPRAADNEAESAAWATYVLSGAGVALPIIDAIRRLILLTRHVEPAGDPAGSLLSDIDLSILGRSSEEFDEFERRIRAEYDWVPEPAYRQGRRQVLSQFLARDPLYLTQHFRRRYETTARNNLGRAIARLTDGVTS
jgi:predicted metal-dependent HD superfamily phosphohydrolase